MCIKCGKWVTFAEMYARGLLWVEKGEWRGGVPRRKIICLQNIVEIEKVKEMREEGYVNNIFIKKQMIRIP